MNINNLLLFILLCYSIPICIVYYDYNGNSSVSNIISNQHKYEILFFMILMGIGSILYEIQRGDKKSCFLITLLLVSIYGLISINEESIIHYCFAFLAFISILFFMMRHALMHNNNILICSFVIELLLFLYLLIKNDDIFLLEVLYIVNFCLFYLYLHGRY